MRRIPPTLPVVILLVASSLAAGPATLPVRVEAGRYDRSDTPVSVVVRDDRLGAEVREALDARGGVIVETHDAARVALRLTPDDPPNTPIIVQAERASTDGRDVRLSWVVPGPIAAGERIAFRLDVIHPLRFDSPWRIIKLKGGEELRHGDRPVFRYNSAPVSSPAFGPIQHRDAYIHPAYSPSGALITGDFSPVHPHHRGFFLAYAKAKVGETTLDFWNIHTDKGKIRHEGDDATVVGPVTALISAEHRWDDKAGKSVLREHWDIEAIEVPGAPYRLFDLTSTQRAVDAPFEVLPYRYGGMAYRGPEPFVKGKLDVLNSEGKRRVDGNLKPTRWVDLTGPIADGSTAYAGAMIADHPGNIHHPTVARIHPTALPFFSFVPASETKVVIGRDAPLVFRYRILIHDGRPDAALDERVWRDFAEPPVVKIGPD